MKTFELILHSLISFLLLAVPLVSPTASGVKIFWPKYDKTHIEVCGVQIHKIIKWWIFCGNFQNLLPMVSFKPSRPSIITASLFSSILASILFIVPGFLSLLTSVRIFFLACTEPSPTLLMFGFRICSTARSDKI